jgi:lipid II:glycine glycyltransferase (peptidoglycan interpeptide bridge formation enzyme)
VETRPFARCEISLESPDENWRRLSSNHRRNVGIAEKRGVSVSAASSWEEMEAFYRILANHYNRHLGVPILGKPFFWHVWAKLIQHNHACLLLARLDQQIIGGHLLYFSGKTLISKYCSSRKDGELRRVYVSYALFWDAIRMGIEQGYVALNLGITGRSNTGLLDFKSRFGAAVGDVYFYYYPISGAIPDYENYYKSYSAVKKAWTLMPESVASLFGQMINQWIC